jgi:hypothetical protein
MKVIVPKSGWPVTGQTLVNSGQTISIEYSRPGAGFGNVSSWSADGVAVGSMHGFDRRRGRRRRANEAMVKNWDSGLPGRTTGDRMRFSPRGFAVSSYTMLGWVLASSTVAAPPPPRVETPGTFLLKDTTNNSDQKKSGTVLLDAKGEVLKYFQPYAYSGTRSPDGRSVACVEADVEADRNSNSALRLVLRSLAGKEDPVFLPLKLGQSGSSFRIVWSSSARRILVHETRNDRQLGVLEHLRKYDLDTKRFTDLELPTGFSVTGWSSDETKLLAWSPDLRICWLNADGKGKPDYLTPNTEVSLNAQLSSDDKWILFRNGPTPPKGERWEGLRLTAMDLATKRRYVLNDPGETYSYCWSMDNKRVAFTWQKSIPKGTWVPELEGILFTCDRDGTNRTSVTSRTYRPPQGTTGTLNFFEIHDWK